MCCYLNPCGAKTAYSKGSHMTQLNELQGCLEQIQDQLNHAIKQSEALEAMTDLVSDLDTILDAHADEQPGEDWVSIPPEAHSVLAELLGVLEEL